MDDIGQLTAPALISTFYDYRVPLIQINPYSILAVGHDRRDYATGRVAWITRGSPWTHARCEDAGRIAPASYRCCLVCAADITALFAWLKKD